MLEPSMAWLHKFAKEMSIAMCTLSLWVLQLALQQFEASLLCKAVHSGIANQWLADQLAALA